MTMIGTLLAVFAINATTEVEYLRSDKLRETLCSHLSTELYLQDIPSQLFSDFEKTCVESKTDFVVPADGTTYNEALGRVVGINVNIDHTSGQDLTFKGTTRLARSVEFDQLTGDIILGKWSVVHSDVKFKLLQGAVAKIADLIVTELFEGRAEADVSTYDESTFHEDTAIAALEKEIEEQNNGEYSCGERELIDNESWAWETIEFSESGNYNRAMELLDLVRKMGYVRTAMGSTVVEWEESCAYHKILVYLKGGILISIYYDFTT